jgi:hypothetical protein
MKAKAEKILSTASYILVNLIKDGKCDHLSNDELTDIALDMTMKLVEKIPDDQQEAEYELPSEEECKKVIKEAFRVMNDRSSTKSQLVNAILLKHKIKRMIAEYMISRAEAVGIIKAIPRGNCIDYQLV